MIRDKELSSYRGRGRVDEDFLAFCHGPPAAARLLIPERKMNEPFKGVSGPVCLNEDSGGRQPAGIRRETFEMLALMVVIAASMAVVLDAALFILDLEDA